MGQRRVRVLVDGFTFIGNAEAGEILGGETPMPRGNVAKTLKRHGVERQTLRQGRREMAVYSIDDVERIAKLRAADVERRAADARRSETAKARAAA